MQIYFQKLSISIPNMLFLLKNLRNSTIFFIFAIKFDYLDFYLKPCKSIFLLLMKQEK